MVTSTSCEMSRKVHPAYWTVGVNIQVVLGDGPFPDDILAIVLDYYGQLQCYTFEWNTDSDQKTVWRNDNIYLTERDAKVDGLLYMIDSYAISFSLLVQEKDFNTIRFFDHLNKYHDDNTYNIYCERHCKECGLSQFVMELSDDELENLYEDLRHMLPTKHTLERTMRIVEIKIAY